MASRKQTHQRNFSFVAGLIFLLVALVHLWRVVAGWDVIIDGTAVPMWCSWVAVGFAGVLAFFGLRYGAATRTSSIDKFSSIERTHHG